MPQAWIHTTNTNKTKVINRKSFEIFRIVATVVNVKIIGCKKICLELYIFYVTNQDGIVSFMDA